MFARFRQILRPICSASDLPILTRDQFHRLIGRERNRVHRTGDRFALMLFPPQPQRQSRDTWQRLAAALAQDLRSTDAIGWWQDQQLGCLLASTEVAGAEVVARRAQAASGLRDLQYKILSYPVDSDVPGDDEDSGNDVVGIPAEWASQPELARRLAQPVCLAKRSLDVVAATGGLLVLLPLFVVIGVLIRATSPGPVFFRQWRTGRCGRRFQMLKFRTMCLGAEARQRALRELNERDGPAFKITRDPRVTRIGAALRATSIDELPQLWNVLRGEMSLVGPRPLPCEESDACETWQKERLDVTPGLTCFWQVGDRQRVTFAEWMRMDIRYRRSQSIRQDLSLIFRTLPVVLLRRGAR